MNKISLYILLILTYLGLSASFSPAQKGTPFMENEKLFGNFFQGAPLTVILTDYFTTGFMIKTYFQRYKVFHGFKAAEERVIRTSKEFYEKNTKNLGMALFRRVEKDQATNTTPLPPGSLFVGDTSYGEWRLANSGEKVWQFHRAYHHFPHAFGWGSYNFTLRAYKTMQYHLDNSTPFYGLNNEFGTDGEISKAFLKHIAPPASEKFNLLKHLKKLFTLHPKSKKVIYE